MVQSASHENNPGWTQRPLWSIFDQPPVRGLEISIFQCIISNRKSNEIPKKETGPSRESKVGASRCGVEAYYSLRSLQVERK